MHELHKKGRKTTPAHLISYFDDSSKERIISEAANFSQAIQDKKKVMEDCFKHIRKHNLKDLLKSIQFKIKDAESADDAAKVNELVTEYNELIKGFGR